MSAAQSNLKRSITLTQATGVAFHQVLGGGVIALMGTAIALTGAGTPLAFLVAGIAVLVYSLPVITIGSAMPAVGGRYSYAARLLSPSAGFFTMWMTILVTIQLSMVTLAAGHYVQAILPWADAKIVAVSIMALFFVLNLFGAALSSKVGIYLGIVMIVAFAMYGVLGMPQVDWSHFTEQMPNGGGNFWYAAALLTFATTGAVAVVSDIGGEMKRPKRDIPIAVIVGTLLTVALYIFVAIPAVGVSGVEDSAGKTLIEMGSSFLSSGQSLFFVIGGALFAVIGHVNSLLTAATKPVLAGIEDGWLPRGLGSVNRRFGTPHWLLLGLFVIGAGPVVLGISVEALAGIAGLCSGLVMAVLLIGSWRLHVKWPEAYRAAPFALKKGPHLALVIIGLGILVVQTVLLFNRLTDANKISLVVWLVLGLVVWFVRRGSVAALKQPARGPVAAEVKESSESTESTSSANSADPASNETR